MSYMELKRRLSPMDAFFLHIERDEAPMHVGAVQTYDGRIPFRKFVKQMSERIHLIPRYLQRVVPAPFRLGHPTWEFDPDFDIENHIRKMDMPSPGTDDQFRAIAEQIFSEPLPRDRPLWDITVIYGLQGKRSGMVIRVHHCMVDGIAGVGLMFVLLDAVPNPPPYKVEKQPVPPIPNTVHRLYETLWDSAIDSLTHWTRVLNDVQGLSNGAPKDETMPIVKEFAATMAGLLSPIKRLPFNRPFSGRKRLSFTHFPFAEARAIRKQLGGTVNDVALTVVTGGMRRYLAKHDFPVFRENLRIMMPANMRKEEQRGDLGNQITFVPVQIPLDIKDPIDRIEAIIEITQRLKEERVSDSIGLMFQVVQGMMAPVQEGLVATAASPAGSTMLSLLSQVPPLHMICTNIPGPQIPLYMAGKRLIDHYALVPTCLEMGLTCAITSYDQRLFITLIGDDNTMPDIDFLRDYMEDAFLELRDAAGVEERAPVEFHHAAQRRRLESSA
mgnify:CR=1 FL=1